MKSKYNKMSILILLTVGLIMPSFLKGNYPVYPQTP